jgi:hypothetical protein
MMYASQPVVRQIRPLAFCSQNRTPIGGGRAGCNPGARAACFSVRGVTGHVPDRADCGGGLLQLVDFNRWIEAKLLIACRQALVEG